MPRPQDRVRLDDWKALTILESPSSPKETAESRKRLLAIYEYCLGWSTDPLYWLWLVANGKAKTKKAKSLDPIPADPTDWGPADRKLKKVLDPVTTDSRLGATSFRELQNSVSAYAASVIFNPENTDSMMLFSEGPANLLLLNDALAGKAVFEPGGICICGLLYWSASETERLMDDAALSGAVLKAARRRQVDLDYLRSTPTNSTHEPSSRTPIPEDVRHEVWRRDAGKCVRCGSRERLEFDHIIPHAMGGSDSARNLELLCEVCNRKKGKSL